MRSNDNDDFDYQDYVNCCLPDYRKKIGPVFEKIHKQLKEVIKDQAVAENKAELSPKLDQPHAIFCLDEARHLFFQGPSEESDDMRFLAFRLATRHQTRVRDPQSGITRDNKRFFALLLDTSSRVSAFSPPREHDPSKKFLRPGDLFAPIYKIDSKDVFARDSGAESRSETTVGPVRLFSLGRPLWGAYLDAGQGWQDVEQLASEKVCNRSNDTQVVALLSYRINFYVVDHRLAEELTSGYLRYIVGISDDRKFLQTMQPSEPILAHISATEMKDRTNRLDVVKALYRNITHGTIHIGDIGEIVAALILLFAFDKTHTKSRPGPVQFSQFLGSLLGNDVCLGLKPCIDDDNEMQRLWTDGYVFFNHFASPRRSLPMRICGMRTTAG